MKKLIMDEPYVIVAFFISITIGFITAIGEARERSKSDIPKIKAKNDLNSKRKEEVRKAKDEARHQRDLEKARNYYRNSTVSKSKFNFNDWFINKLVTPVIISTLLACITLIVTGEWIMGGAGGALGFVGSLFFKSST
jgi:hypothetical protein